MLFGLVETALAASEATATPGIASSLGLDWRLFLGQLLNFLVVFFVLWRFVFKPVSAALHKRQGIVEESLKNADLVKSKMEDLQVEYDRTIAKAKADANMVLDQARNEAQKQSQAMIGTAKEEVLKILVQGKQALQSERAAVVEQARKDVINMVVTSTEKILQGVVDKDVDEAWLKAQLNKTK